MTDTNPLVAHARQLIADEREAIARAKAVREQHATAIQEMAAEIDRLAVEVQERELEAAECSTEIATHERQLRELEQALAMLEERLTKPKELSPERQRVHRELDEMMRSRPGPREERPEGAIGEHAARVAERKQQSGAADPRGSQPRPRKKDPMVVLERNVGSHPAPKPNGLTPVYEGGGAAKVDMDNLSATDSERADLALMLMADAGGRMSQVDLAQGMGEMLEVSKPATASSIASRALAILYKQGRVEYTGDKGPVANGRLASPVYRVKEGK